MVNYLDGKIETVKIIDYLPKYKNYNPYGFAQGLITSINFGNRVIVRNSDVHIGKEILVRFRSKINEDSSTPLGQFLRIYNDKPNKEILNHFSKMNSIKNLNNGNSINFQSNNIENIYNKKISLKNNEYLLYGIWNNNWEINDDLPTLDEICYYFDPGELGRVNLFLRNSSEYRNRFTINSDKIEKLYGSYNQIISKIKNKLDNGDKHSNLFIFESHNDAYSLIKQAKKFNLKCIKLDSLDNYYSFD